MQDPEIVDPNCIGCGIAGGSNHLPGGIIHETDKWIINHCTGPLGLGTIVIAPCEHIVRITDLTRSDMAELGALTHTASVVISELTEPEQVYACMWSHGQQGSKHLHWVLQPITAALMNRFPWLRAERLQVAMFDANVFPLDTEIEEFCDDARAAFRSTFD